MLWRVLCRVLCWLLVRCWRAEGNTRQPNAAKRGQEIVTVRVTPTVAIAMRARGHNVCASAATVDLQPVDTVVAEGAWAVVKSNMRNPVTSAAILVLAVVDGTRYADLTRSGLTVHSGR